MSTTTAAPEGLDELRQMLVAEGRVEPSAHLSLLRGGVSSLVAVVDDAGERWVVKTPLARLAVDAEWRADRRRGANEAAILRHLDGAVGPARTPRLRFFDPSATVLGEELLVGPLPSGSAPAYKEELLAGRVRPDVAAALGAAAAALHRLAPPPELRGDGPRRLFDALRLDPYYRATAVRRPELAEPLAALVSETVDAAPRTLVHGDYTPKNVLVLEGSPAVLDWEVVHTGDPSFDLGVVTAHLVLKALRTDPTGGFAPLLAAAGALWDAYDGPADRQRAVRHAGGVMLARLYGKSPVEYLSGADERDRAHRVGEMALRGRFADERELRSAAAREAKEAAAR